MVDKLKKTTVQKVFAAGDVEKGASLVVHAIEAGKLAAASVDAFLRGADL
jgi:glutamate synthase (NADPH/NADH) small chain